MDDTRAILVALLRANRDIGVPPQQIDDFVITARAGELHLALEMFCEQLHEHEVALAPELLAALEQLAAGLELAPKHLERLRTRT